MHDVNITRHGEEWGIRVPFDPEFTIYVWFDALLTYITGIGYGDDEATFQQVVAVRHALHRQGHHALPLRPLAGDAVGRGRASRRSRCSATASSTSRTRRPATVEKISKSLGNVVEPMEIITKFSAEAFRYYFLRECPFPGDGEFSWQRFAEVYNSDLANNLGNLLSRAVTLTAQELRRRARRHGRQECPSRSCRGSNLAAFVGDGSRTRRGVPVQPGAAGDRAGLPDADQPVPRSERAVEAGEDRQGGGQEGAVQRGAVAARREHPAQAVPPAVGRDDLHELQLPEAVGAR